MIINNTLSNSEVFILILDNRLLEVSEESQNLSIILQPLWSDSRDGIILKFLSSNRSSKLAWLSFSHVLDQIFVHIFFNGESFLLA